MDENGTKQMEQSRLLYDTPIDAPEQDRLLRAPFAAQVAESILNLNAEEGFVFSLNGPWGSGKTSIINLVLHYIEAKKADTPGIVVVRFNPWWFSGQEHLIQQFFRQFRAAIGSKDAPVDLQRIGGALDTLANILAPLELLSIPGASIFAGGMKKIGQSLASVGKRRLDDVHVIRRVVDQALRKQQARILVVIDDIDRLPSDEIRHVFRLVKAVADFPKTIYLLAFDIGVVVNALNQACDGAGQEYLDKIVQAPLDVPLVDRVMLRRNFSEQLNKVLQGTPVELYDQTAWGNLFWDGIDPFIQTPRQVKRLINRLRATYPMVLGEVHAVDFIAIQTLRTFVPSAYVFVQQNKDLFAGANQDYGYGGRDDRDERQKRAEAFLAELDDKDRDTVKELLSRTFPLWGWIFPGGSMHGADWLSEWRRFCRACSPEVFDRYFMLSIPPGDIGAAEMRSILSSASNKESFMAEVLRLSKERRPDNTTRLRAFWERMEDFTRDIPQEHFPPILETIFDIGDQVVDADNSVGMFDFGDDMRMGRIVYQIIKRLPTQAERAELLFAAMSHGRAVHRIVSEVAVLGQEHGKFGERSELKPEPERIVGSDELVKLERLALDRIHAAADEDRLHAAPDFWRILVCWAQWENEDGPAGFVKALIEADRGFADFIQTLLNEGRSWGMTDRVTKSRWTVNVKTAVQFSRLTEEALADRAERILKERHIELSQRDTLALETLVRDVRDPVDDFGLPRRRRE